MHPSLVTSHLSLQARDFRHENVIQFVGACVEPGSILLVLRLCAKGGLDDLLQNTDIQLDLSFRVSIAMDIINVSIDEECQQNSY